MSEIKIGDRGKCEKRDCTIKGIDEDIAWVKFDEGGYASTINFVPAPKTFEVGKIYQHEGCHVLRFTCKDRGVSKFSGELELMSNIIGSVFIYPEKFSDWEEI